MWLKEVVKQQIEKQLLWLSQTALFWVIVRRGEVEGFQEVQGQVIGTKEHAVELGQVGDLANIIVAKGF